MTAMLQAKGLQSFYGDSHILHGVDLTLNQGETLSLLGRNGMGKSTTLKTIMGIVRPREGSVAIGGQDMTGASPHRVAKAGVAYVPEGRGIFPNLTVRENLEMTARPGVDGSRDWTYQRVLDIFPRLAERLDHWGNHLSGGEQQMLTIGRALLTNPRVLLLDEATEGLAPLIREEIWQVVRAIKDSGLSTVIVDKNIKRLVDLADRHVMLVKGRVIFEGDSKALLADPDLLHENLGV